MFHPEVATRSCTHCQEVIYYEDGESAGTPLIRGGKEVKRHKNLPPPCRTSVGCPKGTPENPKTLTEKNELAYLHYQECDAVRHFPNDAIVRQNAAIIRRIEKLRKRRDEIEFQNLLIQIAVPH